MANWYPAGSKRGRVLSTVTDRSTKISGTQPTVRPLIWASCASSE